MRHEELSGAGAEIREHQQGLAVMERLIAVAEPSTVFGQPMSGGEYTVITASEVAIGLGFGYGGGGGIAPAADAQSGAIQQMAANGYGRGVGGGGGASARPVAIISIGPNGVQVKPVIDQTKIVLALLTGVGAMLLSLRKMIKAGRK
ncbi:MAG TPA: spore germination protein GerW family protein [Herpetosiphonaceae bacterium]|nr:spore germination protein GerW family protein [Herpetosiphonaceae bacterium]